MESQPRSRRKALTLAFRKWLRSWHESARLRPQLDSLFKTANPQAPLLARLYWLMDLFQWLRSPGLVILDSKSHQTGSLQATRVRYLLQVLEKNPEWKSKVSETLRSIIRDSSALELFCLTGLSVENSFVSELLGRVFDKFIPKALKERDLNEIFPFLFSNQIDILWLKNLEPHTLLEITKLLGHEIESDPFATLKLDLEDSLLFLSGQIRTYGLRPEIRARLPHSRLRDNSFFLITRLAHLYVESLKGGARGDSVEFREHIEVCREDLEIVRAHLSTHGVSIDIVFEMDRIEQSLNRLISILNVMEARENQSQTTIFFLCELIEQSLKRRGVKTFFNEQLSMLSRKVSEHAADVGEHYIARTPKEKMKMFLSAAGGGVLTAVTAFIKIGTDSWGLAEFGKGLLASVNYATSFSFIQFLGFTLATKQPAMTANALAEKMRDITKDGLALITEEIRTLLRSQLIAVAGNLLFVIPTAIAVDYLLVATQMGHLLTPPQALGVLEKHSILGLTPLYAAFTGVLLWLGSLTSGWAQNWLAYREIPLGLKQNFRLKLLFGPKTLEKFSGFLHRNFGGVVGNIVLGILLGMTPKIGAFLGLPAEVRHVTLAAGSIFYAASTLGVGVLGQLVFWKAFFAIFVIGLFNLAASFGLALFVAMKARKLTAENRDKIYKFLFSGFRLSSPTK